MSFQLTGRASRWLTDYLAKRQPEPAKMERARQHQELGRRVKLARPGTRVTRTANIHAGPMRFCGDDNYHDEHNHGDDKAFCPGRYRPPVKAKTIKRVEKHRKRLCWRILSDRDGRLVCILDKGHGGGMHEPSEDAEGEG